LPFEATIEEGVPVLLSEDVRENPGTLALGVSWIVVFVVMLLVQSRHPIPAAPGPKFEPLSVSTVTSHRFGDMTWMEVRQGEPWRLVTATFVHFGLIHLALNGLALLNLGRLVEPWYRTGPFLAICLAIGGLGNLIGGSLRQLVAVARPWLASQASSHHWPGLIERFLRGQGGPAAPVSIHTGGGSTILLGLLTLAAVVGWRSKTRIGAHLQKQMIILLALTAALGAAMSNLVDNYGHLGGALAGAAIGLIDRPLHRLSEAKAFRAACWVFFSVVACACFGAMVRDDLAENDFRRRYEMINVRGLAAERTRIDLNRLFGLYARMVFRSVYFQDPVFELDAFAMKDLLERGPSLAAPSKVDPQQVSRDREELGRLLFRLEEHPVDLWGKSVTADLARLQQLGRSAFEYPPDYAQVYDFVVCWRSATRVIDADLIRLNARRISLEATADRPR
jgi:rhomboid protease GluP